MYAAWRRWKACLAGILTACSCACPRPPALQGSLVNFSHLEHLCEWRVMDGDSVVIVHIYAEAPDYHWVPAPGEGIACVDDAARAAVALLRHATLTGDTSRLHLARGLLRFVLKLQTEDGEFCNFVDHGLQINSQGATSRKGFGFTAARAYWALASAYRFFVHRDAPFATELRQAFLRCRAPLAKLLDSYQQYEVIQGRRYPKWLVQQYAADATSELLLGLAEYLRAEQNPELSAMARQLCDGLLAMQLEESERYPGAFLSWSGVWHAWGNAQSQALTDLGALLGDKRLLAAAEREARQFSGRMLAEGQMHQFVLGEQIQSSEFPQIAYDIRCTALGLLGVAQATGDTTFAVAAGLVAGWFFGNNPAGQPMYDTTTGMCYDGLEGPERINRNAGAESTVEALLTLLEVLHHPVAARYISYRSDTTRACPTSPGYTCRVFSGGVRAATVCFDHQALDFTISVGSRTEPRTRKASHRR
ncbi:MAG: hypothetical protein ONB25_04440 [candidate division KSB1 bacterium]|nr:hypothetical protein [candidate division KSB1 bacterium]